jgi:phage terminase small subunit
MARRKIDPLTGQKALTLREQKLIQAYAANGGNGKLAAIAAGYSSHRAAQAAYQVLRKPAVQERLRAAVAQADVSYQEVVGTLASQMRGDIAGCFDSNGRFDLALASSRGLDHLIKSVTTAVHPRRAHRGEPDAVQIVKVDFHSSQKAAIELARITGLKRKPGDQFQSILNNPADNRPCCSLDLQQDSSDHSTRTT